MLLHAGHMLVDLVQLGTTAKHEAAVVVEGADKVPGICGRDGLVGVVQQRGLVAVDCGDCEGIGGGHVVCVLNCRCGGISIFGRLGW